MACCEKYKALILKYVPYISKYMAYIFYYMPCVLFYVPYITTIFNNCHLYSYTNNLQTRN